MINAKELRIGNLVQDAQGDIQYVYRLWNGGAELASDMYGNDDMDYSEEEMFGIHLSESMLIDFGFTKRPSGQFVIKANEYEWINVQVDKQEICHSLLDKGVSTPYNYIHELQNLYFALSGKELTIK